jgi:tRNA A58 N-methylase Trm61
MVVLVAMLSSGKGSWGRVNSLLKLGEWSSVYLICNDFSEKNFEVNSQNVIKLRVDEQNPQKSINVLSKFFKENVKGEFDVAVNIDSGSGMEHMILISSILKSGLGLRMVYPHNNEIKELKIMEKFLPEGEEDNFLF